MPSPSAPRPRARPGPDRAGAGAGGTAGGGPTAAYAAAICGVVLAASVFLPWYATNLGAPFTTGSASGWEWTSLARVTLALAVVAAAASAALVLRDRGTLAVEPEIVTALGWATVGAHAGAVALVTFRVIFPPEPVELISRELGLYLALLAAVAGVAAGATDLAARR